jgi:DNA invertase Pin-like site-specific DNA recombinase
VRVAIYLRVSTTEQAREGYSIEHQMAACLAHAAAMGWEVAGVWQDVESGRNDGRERYRALLTASGWDAVLVWKADRLGRDEAELFRVVKELRRADRRIVSVTENVEDPFVLGLLFLLAAREGRLIGERVRPINQRLTREGRHVSRPPFGYRMIDKRLVVDLAEAALYLEMVERLEGGWSFRAVALAWNARGLRTRQGVAWQHSTISDMARNPLYAGLVRRAGVDGLVDGQHAPLIERARWDALQSRLGAVGRAWSHMRPSGARTGPSALLTGFFRCACGSAMVYSPHRYREWRNEYYECSGHAHGAACPHRRLIPLPLADGAVERWLAPILTGDGPALAAAATRWAAAVAAGGDADGREEERRRWERSAAAARQRLARLVDALVDDLVGQDEYHERRAEYQAQLEVAEAALAALPAPGAYPDLGALAVQADRLAQVGRSWDRGTRAERREVLRGLGAAAMRTSRDSFTVSGDDRLTPFLPPWTVTMPPMRRASRSD